VLEIYVDGDACPVKAEAERVAARHNLPITIVSNGGLRPSRHPLIRHVVVGDGADAADDWIVEHAGQGDIVVTADIPLASRCLEKRARVLGPNGKPFTSMFAKRRARKPTTRNSPGRIARAFLAPSKRRSRH
jgi:uncharacterized protein YaiI (UPF0178 family)